MGLGVAQALTAPGLDVNWALMLCTFSSWLPTMGAFRAVGAHCFPSVAPNCGCTVLWLSVFYVHHTLRAVDIAFLCAPYSLCCGYWLSVLYVHHVLHAVDIGFLCAPYFLCCGYWVLALHAVGALV